MKELVLKKCDSCGLLVKVIIDCTCECKCDDNCTCGCKEGKECTCCGIKCCGKAMRTLKANEVDATKEKHIPEYTIENDLVNVKVNHVMDSDHYIEWICALSDNKEEYVYFKPGEDATASFKKYPNMKLYSYCNKHSLWSSTIK